MQKSNSSEIAKVARRKAGASTTLNRKYVRRPTKTKVDTMVQSDAAVKVATIKKTVDSRMKERSIGDTTQAAPARVTAKELKEQAIKKALAEATLKSSAEEKGKKSKKVRQKAPVKLHFGFGRIMLALFCATIAVVAIVYFVNLNMPDFSLRVAAMQTGIDASYPSYVPRDYSTSSITYEDSKVTLDFKNSSNGGAFTIVEEASSWDSNALMTNYVKSEYGENYTIVREQGLTIYISGSNAAWVNGGIVYKIKTTSGSLTNKQIKTIATSL